MVAAGKAGATNGPVAKSPATKPAPAKRKPAAKGSPKKT
jgi:hypothetical protein